jgi:hypothetical protein
VSLNLLKKSMANGLDWHFSPHDQTALKPLYRAMFVARRAQQAAAPGTLWMPQGHGHDK